MLYEMGVPIEHIQNVLRHANPTIIKTLYVDTTEKVQRAAIDELRNCSEATPMGDIGVNGWSHEGDPMPSRPRRMVGATGFEPVTA